MSNILFLTFFRIESELKKLYNLGSVFASVYDHLKTIQTKKPISNKIHSQIVL